MSDTATTISTITPFKVKRVAFDAPWSWLADGWRDMWNAPQISLVYGAVFTGISLVILIGLYFAGAVSLVLPLAGGFLLLGPVFAIGLYETSRLLNDGGAPPQLSDLMNFSAQAPGQLAFMGVFLLIIYFIWLELAFLLFMLFLGPQELQLQNFIPMLLLTGSGLGLLVAGTATGAVLALVVFAVSAISIPMLMRRRVDAVTAAATSVRAVALNPQAMLLWAALIAGMTAFAFATLFVGLVIVFPLIGHATWHAYRALLDPAAAAKKRR